MIEDRDLQILKLVVDAYVRDGAPVSSRTIKESTGLPLSTATIRNVMAHLERAGYLQKPHTSAGRVPTDEGYRLYVDHLVPVVPTSDEFAARLRDELREQSLDIGSVMATASRILGSLSKHLAVIYGSTVPESWVSRLQLIDLEGGRLLVVIHLIPDYERTIVLRLEKRFGPDVIRRAEELINRVVENNTLPSAKDALDAIVRDNVTDEGIITREVAIHRQEIFSEPPAVELYFEERGYLLDQPELADPRPLQLLVRLLHDKAYVTSILSARLGERTQITIGHENENEELQPFSLVTAGYRLGGARGVLGIIGPTRMRYDLVSCLVGSAARELRAVGEEYF